MAATFLTADWNKLIMVNYEIDPEILLPYLPDKTEIDLWNGKCFLSLVGFMFSNTRVLGFKIPYHINFEEINLRFYVRHCDKKGINKRGVVFIKEIVPKKLIAYMANKFFHENYETMLTKHEWKYGGNNWKIAYFWGRVRWNSIWVEGPDSFQRVEVGSEEEFITEHYWGFSKIDDLRTSIYEVVHPKWKVYKVKRCFIDVNFEGIYGKEFAFLRNQKYSSVFLAEGSEVAVKMGKIIY